MSLDVAEIVIRRDSERDIKFRGLEVFLDGTFIVDLFFNTTYRINVLPGEHTVKVSNHLYKKSVKVNVQNGETVNLLAGNNFTLLGGLMVSALGIGPYRVFLSEVDSP